MGKADFELFSKDLDKIYTRLNSLQISLSSFIHSKVFFTVPLMCARPRFRG